MKRVVVLAVATAALLQLGEGLPPASE